MTEETKTILAAATISARTLEDAPVLAKKIDKITYKVRAYFSKISNETISDKIKRMPKNKIQQM